MSLDVIDPEITELCKAEKERQKSSLELIASENFVSQAVLEALSSCFHNKYSEGQVGARYYGGNEVVDKMESLCQQRALKLFNLDPSEWGVNVQPLSGSPANLAVYVGLVGPHGRIMGLDLPDGGHLSHGYQTASGRKPVRLPSACSRVFFLEQPNESARDSLQLSASSLFFESVAYKVDPETGLIDYANLEKVAHYFRPKLIIAGTSAYPRYLDYSRFRQIADSVSALLLGDMAHISGLVAAGLHPSPFDYCDIVSTTSHKTLRGPRGAMIFYRKTCRPKNMVNGYQNGDNHLPVPTDFQRRINDAVFPGLQGGPHNNSIAALAVALKEADSTPFKQYQAQVLANMRQLCQSLQKKGYKLVTDGSDTHLCLLDLRPNKIDASRAERVMELTHIAVNKNTCPGDTNALKPSGLRLGSPALTSRGLKEVDFEQVSVLIQRALEITSDASAITTGKLMKDFEVVLQTNDDIRNRIAKLGQDVGEFASGFPMPGLDS